MVCVISLEEVMFPTALATIPIMLVAPDIRSPTHPIASDAWGKGPGTVLLRFRHLPHSFHKAMHT